MSDDQQKPPADGGDKGEMPVDVLRREYAEAKADMLRYKEDAKKLREQYESLEKQVKSTKDTELADQQKYKELAEIKAKELEETQKKFNELQGQVQRQTVHNAIADELQKRGIKADPAWVGAESVEEVAKAVDAFEEKHPHLKQAGTPTQDPRKPSIHSTERWWLKPSPTDDEFGKMTPDQYAEWRKNYSRGGQAFGSF